MKYLITGGCGFIGVNFAEKLLKRGDEVVLLDNLSRTGATINLEHIVSTYPKASFIHTDVRTDIRKLEQAVTNVDVVFHLAGQVAVTSSVINPREDFEVNALGTFNLLEAIRKLKKKPILIYASTNKVYGGMEDIETEEGDERYYYKDLPHGISEDRTLDFHSPYGCSKGAAEQYVRDYARIYGMPTVVMRQSCIYGPRQFGVEDQGWLAWFTIAALLKTPITIYGDGKQVRDVLFVDDLFVAWDLAAKKIKKTKGKVYNVGGGSENTLSLLEFLKLLKDTLDIKVKYSFSDWRPGDQPVYVSDTSKIKSDLRWKPTMTATRGVKVLASWIEENKDIIKKQLSVNITKA